MTPYRPGPWSSKLDFAATALLAVGLFATASAVGQEPSGANLLGSVGGWLARSLFESLGLAVYFLLAGWFVLVVLLYLRQSWFAWSRRLAGFALLVPCAAVWFSRYAPAAGPGAPFGAGGTVGAWLSEWLAGRWPAATQLAALAGVTAAGAALAFDRLILAAARAGRRVGRLCVPSVGRPVHRTRPAAVARPAAARPRPVPRGKRETSAAVPETEPPPRDHELPPLELLEDGQPLPYTAQDPRLRERAGLLEKTFADFGLNVRVVGIHTGPVITQYEIALETGLRLNKVTALADDLALNLGVPSVRVVAPIPGKNTVGIEVPNEKRAVVRLKELIKAATAKGATARLPLFLGKDTEGRPLVYDLAEMPHLLIAGRTGTGKSVCMNAVILSLLMTRTPEEVRMIMIDPKMLELSEYGKIPHLMHPVVKDMKKAEAILGWAVDKMEERYEILARARVRSIAAYNELSPAEIHRRVNPADDDERKRLEFPMPFIVIFIDEMNDLMMTMKKEVEAHVIRLAQKSRAAGIHLIVATQKPTVDVITGLIKSNLPARICFQVSSRTDSRVVLDEMGADKLLGKGDLLFLQPGTSTIIRAQGTYASDEEIQRVVGELECEPEYVNELVALKIKDEAAGAGGDLRDRLRARDDLYEQAIDVVVREGRGSVSLLQRALGIGYGRAARLIDFMAEDGIVGIYNGSQARDVIISLEEWADMRAGRRSGAGPVGAEDHAVHAG
jgi:S-DNA-T family DNA segregation ATPase FtsK/SpoIIIE